MRRSTDLKKSQLWNLRYEILWMNNSPPLDCELSCAIRVSNAAWVMNRLTELKHGAKLGDATLRSGGKTITELLDELEGLAIKSAVAA